uniref:Putative oxidoreductase n=1 Tax=mine drainage metagenome TaxID=410659 RepID=E6Q0H3_9ZZZZ
MEEIPTPEPAAGEIRVRVRAAALNRRDAFITRGLYPGIALPCTLGSDGCGVVDALGAGASGPCVGEEVVIDPMLGWGAERRIWADGSGILGMPHPGTLAQFVCVPAANVHAKPAHLDSDRAAALPLAGLTAYRALITRARLRAGETVLIPGIGSGVQSFALLFAKAIGARAIVTSSSDEKLVRARALGADVTVNYAADPQWFKALKSAGAIDVAIDGSGGETFARILDLVRPGGRVAIYGGTGGDAKIRPFSIFWKQLDVLGSSMGSPEDFRDMLALVSEKRIEPVLGAVYPLADIVAAVERLESGANFGKIVVTVG